MASTGVCTTRSNDQTSISPAGTSAETTRTGFYTNHGGASDGDSTRFDYLVDTLADQDLSVPTNYAEVSEYLDIDGFIDYLVASFYIGLSDWPGNNWYYGDRADSSPLGPLPGRFFAWDGEWSFDVRNGGGAPNGAWVNPDFRNGASSNRDIPTLWHALRENTDFMDRFAARVHAHVTGDGALTDANALARWTTLSDSIELAVLGESARWGDGLEALGEPVRTRDVDWQNEVDAIAGILDGNAAVLIAALQAEGYFPSVAAPAFDLPGGEIVEGSSLTLVNPDGAGDIYFTTDGSDPRGAGGGVSGSAALFDGTPIVIETDQTVSARVLDEDEWSLLEREGYTVAEPDPDVDAPVVSVVSPGEGEVVGAGVVEVSGSVVDESALVWTYMVLNNTVTGEYWNGSAWQSSWAWFLVPVDGGGLFASSVDLGAGEFRVRVYSRDAVGLTGDSGNVSFVVSSPDVDAPVVSVVSPGEGEVVGAGVVEVSGSVVDESALVWTYMVLNNTVTGEYWNGSAWQSSWAWFLVPVDGGGLFASSVDLGAGEFRVRVYSRGCGWVDGRFGECVVCGVVA